MIELKDFSLGFKGKDLIRNVSTSFENASLTAIIGRNGSGKSTLLKAICGLNPFYQGKILINNLNLKDFSSSKLARSVSFVNTQRPRIANMKVIDVVGLGRSPYTGWSGKLGECDRKIIFDAIDKVGMSEYAIRSIDSLSDGECQKIMIARAIAQDTDIILLDEPTSFLDLPTRYELVTLLKELAENQHKTIVFSTHELDIALKISHYIALLNAGSLLNIPSDQMKDSHILPKIFPSLQIF